MVHTVLLPLAAEITRRHSTTASVYNARQGGTDPPQRIRVFVDKLKQIR